MGRAVGFGEDRLLRRVEPYLPSFGVEEGVVPAAEEYAVVHGGGAAVLPVDAVVDVPPAGGSIAVGKPAVPVSESDGVAHGFRPDSGGPSDVEDFAFGAEHDSSEARVAQSFDGLDCFGVEGSVGVEAHDEADVVAV